MPRTPAKKATTTPSNALSTLNDQGKPTTTTPPKKATTPKKTPVSGATSSGDPFAGTDTAPSSTSDQDLYDVSSDTEGDKLVGSNPSTYGGTIGSAVASISSMSSADITQLQNQLVAAHLLTGKFTAGVADPETVTAWTDAVKDSTRNNSSVSDYLSSLSGASIDDVTTSTPSYTDPTDIASALSTAFDVYGKKPTAADLSTFAGQIDSLETDKTSDHVSVDVSTEAASFASKQLGPAPNDDTKLSQDTDADITKAASTFGVDLSPTQRANITANVDANIKATGSSDVNLVNQLVAKQFKMPSDPADLSGDAATVYNDLTKLAGQYLLPTTAVTLGNWITKAIRNQSYAGSLTGDTEAEFEQYLRQQAAVQYPWLAASTQNFETVNPWDATSSYRTQIANILGLADPDSVDLTGTYSGLLKSPTGDNNPPTMQDITSQILNDPKYGYDESPNGIGRGYSVGIALAKSLGVNLAGV